MRRTTIPGHDTLEEITVADERPIEIIDVSAAGSEDAFLSESGLGQCPSDDQAWIAPGACQPDDARPAAERTGAITRHSEATADFDFVPEEDLGDHPMPAPSQAHHVEHQPPALPPRLRGASIELRSEPAPETTVLVVPPPRPPLTRGPAVSQPPALTRPGLWRVPSRTAASVAVAATAVLVAAFLYSAAPWRLERTGDATARQFVTDSQRTRDDGQGLRGPVQAAAPQGMSAPANHATSATVPTPPLTSEADHFAQRPARAVTVVPQVANTDSGRQARPRAALLARAPGASQLEARAASLMPAAVPPVAVVDEPPLPARTVDAGPRDPESALAMVEALGPAVVEPAVAVGQPSATQLPPPAHQAASVRALLAAYESAYERLDARSVRELWPTVDERALARAFAGLESQTVRLDSCTVTLGEMRGMASCTGTATYVTRIGNRSSRTEAREWTFLVANTADHWVIETVQTR